jgi:DNA-binding HxlR family transcriptional regulator
MKQSSAARDTLRDFYEPLVPDHLLDDLNCAETMTTWEIITHLAANTEGESFGEIKEWTGFSSRTVTKALSRLRQEELLDRKVKMGFPPTVNYSLRDQNMVRAGRWLSNLKWRMRELLQQCFRNRPTEEGVDHILDEFHTYVEQTFLLLLRSMDNAQKQTPGQPPVPTKSTTQLVSVSLLLQFWSRIYSFSLEKNGWRKVTLSVLEDRLAKRDPTEEDSIDLKRTLLPTKSVPINLPAKATR